MFTRLKSGGCFLVITSVVSPGHVDVPVPGPTCHLAEGDSDADSDHQREGDHPPDHIGCAAVWRTDVMTRRR